MPGNFSQFAYFRTRRRGGQAGRMFRIFSGGLGAVAGANGAPCRNEKAPRARRVLVPGGLGHLHRPPKLASGSVVGGQRFFQADLDAAVSIMRCSAEPASS